MRLRVCIDPSLPLIALAQCIAQHPVDHGLEPGHQHRGRLHRLIHDRVRLLRALAQTQQGDQQQRMDGRRRHGVQQTIQHDTATAEVAQRTPGEITDRTARSVGPGGLRLLHAFVSIGEIAALEHR